MDAIAFIWKTLLTKVSIKTLILSMSFDCFLSGSSRLYRKPACCVLFSTSGPSGWKELLSMALCPVYAFLCLWAGLPNPTAALKPTRAVLTFPGWSDFIAYNFSSDPGCRGCFSPPWLGSSKFLIQDPFPSKLLQKEQATWNC